MCRWQSCTIYNANIYDEPMYVGRLEVMLNNGKKENIYTSNLITKLRNNEKRI